MDAPRVLFLHGLEGHPNGTKVQAMRAAGLTVDAPDMGMGLWRTDRVHSVLRQLPRLGEVRLAGVVAVLGLALAPWTPVSALLTPLALGWLLARRETLFARALSRSFDDCVRVAAEAAARSDADVLVGSSWGGAVAAELLASGRWTRPTILLAPAIGRVHRRGRRDDAPSRLAGLAATAAHTAVWVFHDPSDDVVPFADSTELATRAPIELRSVDAGGHRLLGLLEDGTLVATIHEVADSPDAPR